MRLQEIVANGVRDELIGGHHAPARFVLQRTHVPKATGLSGAAQWHWAITVPQYLQSVLKWSATGLAAQPEPRLSGDDGVHLLPDRGAGPRVAVRLLAAGDGVERDKRRADLLDGFL